MSAWKLQTIGVLVFALLMSALVRHEEQQIRELKQIRDALIELNHSKSEYIDAGCRGRYQGTEELLPGEK